MNIGEGFDLTISLLLPLPLLSPCLFFHPTPHAYRQDTYTQIPTPTERGWGLWTLFSFSGPLPPGSSPPDPPLWGGLSAALPSLAQSGLPPPRPGSPPVLASGPALSPASLPGPWPHLGHVPSRRGLFPAGNLPCTPGLFIPSRCITNFP